MSNINARLIKYARQMLDSRGRQLSPFTYRRERLNPQEQANLEEAKSRWFRKFFQDLGDPVTADMASPTRQGLLAGVPAGLASALVGHIVAKALDKDPTAGAAIGGGLGGLTAFLAKAYDTRERNEALEELMHRMPPNANMMDLWANPAYGAGEDPKALLRASMLAGGRRFSTALNSPFAQDIS